MRRPPIIDGRKHLTKPGPNAAPVLPPLSQCVGKVRYRNRKEARIARKQQP